MMNLNIISNEQKKEVKKRKILFILKNNLFILIILTSIYTIFFLLSYLTLEVEYSKVLIEKSNIQTTDKDLGTKINNINSQINIISDIQKKSPYWSDFLILFSKNINKNIIINSLSIDMGTIKLSGNAQTRDDLINFQETLEKSDLFENVDFPLKNILSSKNINFDITAKISSYEFK